MTAGEGKGVAANGRTAYLGVMSILPPLPKPSVALADLLTVLRAQSAHKVGFALLAITIPLFLVALILLSGKEVEYKPPKVIFVENWRADRTDAQIKAQQKIDTAKRKVDDAADAARMAKERAEWKKVQDRMKAIGL